MRSFIGIFPPPPVQAAIADLLIPLTTDPHAVRWEREEKFHITLKFLGDILPDQLREIEFRLRESVKAINPFEIRLASLGCFPSRQTPKIVWLGPAAGDDDRMNDCRSAVENTCAAAGLKEETRPFHPHITVGRVKGKVAENLIQKIENTTFEPLQFLCAELLIMKSDLSPSGSAYSQLSSIPLKQ